MAGLVSPSNLLYTMDNELSTLETVMRLSTALILGLILGWERETKKKPAGLRTHMLVSLGSAGFTILTLQLFQTFNPGMERGAPDPLRIINGIMEGLGFLGAGSIIRSRGSVEGITTAATIWVVGSVGLAAGTGNYYLAIVITVLAFTILTVLRALESYIQKRGRPDDQS